MEVNKKQLADIFGASIRTIQNWQEQGMPVLRGGGKGNEVLYDSAAVIKWYAKRDAEIENEKLRREVEELRQASEADLQPGTIEYERHRLTRAQADAQELKNARDSAEVVESTNNTGAHTHSVSGTAASAGAHTHSMTFVSGGSSGAPGSGSPDYSKYSVNTSSAGAHTHSVSGTAASAGAHAHTVGIGAHTHSVAIGSHGHTITVNAAGNAENTVKNIAFNYIVRLA
ncbi:terminase small subunit [Escherichia coli]|nr:terminase small subunit [Escherichia coli]